MCVCALNVLVVCNPIGCSPLGSCLHGILKARLLEWVAISSSRDSSLPGNKPTSLVSMTVPSLVSMETHICVYYTSLVTQIVKNLPAMLETQVPSLGREDALEKGIRGVHGVTELDVTEQLTKLLNKGKNIYLLVLYCCCKNYQKM